MTETGPYKGSEGDEECPVDDRGHVHIICVLVFDVSRECGFCFSLEQTENRVDTGTSEVVDPGPVHVRT